MLDFEKTALWLDVKKILNDTAKPIRYSYTGTLHTEDEDIDVIQVTTIDIVGDYVKNVGDIIQIEFQMPLGDYVKRLFPYYTNIEFTIWRRELTEDGTGFATNKPKAFIKYKAIFDPDQNEKVRGTENDQLEIETLNNKDVVSVKLQLMERALEPLRIKTTGGIYRNITPYKLIHSVLGSESAKVLVDGKKAIDGLDIVEPNNKSSANHIVLPHNLKVINVPTFIQHQMGGVYTAGIGTYFRGYNNKRYWFVYPLYNTGRFDEHVPKAIFYALPRNRYTDIERSYRVDNDVLHIAISGERSYKDSADTDYMDSGVGFRMADARAFMKKPVKITEDGPVGKRSNLNHEVGLEARSDGLNYAPASSRGISSNAFVEYSKVLARRGGQVTVEWQHSKQDLIYPGMPCKYMFIEEDKIVSLKGIVLFSHTVISLDQQGINAKNHTSSTFLYLYVEPYKMSKID